MFISEGIVYGSEPEQPIKVEQVKVLPEMMLLIKFNNGEIRLFDSTSLEGPAFDPLHDEEVFSAPVIDHGVIMWQNEEIDCTPEYMYRHSYEYSTDG